MDILLSNVNINNKKKLVNKNLTIIIINNCLTFLNQWISLFYCSIILS